MMRGMEADTVAADQPNATPAPSSASTRTRMARSFEIILTLALADLRARYGRGRWQLFRWLIDPYAVVGVYLVFVAVILNRGGVAPGLSVACAVLPFQLFLTTTFRALLAVRDRGPVILNVGFPRHLIPAATTLTETFGFVSSLTLLPVMMIIYGIAPTTAVLWMPAVLATTVVFALACAYPTALFGLWSFELIAFAQSALRVLFFLAPGVVALDQIGGSAADWVRLNPLTGIFQSYRDVLISGQSPAAWELLYPLGVSALLLVAFVPSFRRESKHLAKVV
jgi:ABC-type polysaccharide/polyol phosphate export permease